MKKYLLLVFLVTSLKGLACSCGFLTLSEKYIEADFVARIKLLKNYPNQGEKEIYKSDIEILELFKGKLTTSLWMEGSSDGIKRSTCDLLFKENTEIIVYAEKRKDGDYMLYQCSDPVTNEGYNRKFFIKELSVLRFLKDQNITYTHKSRYGTNTHDLLEKYKGVSFDKTFAIYEIIFTEKSQVDSVRSVIGFSESFDKQFIESLKKARWGNGYDPDGVGLKGRSFPNNTTFIVLYYYPPEKEDESFISVYNL